MKIVFHLILCFVGTFGLTINFDSNLKGLEVKVNSPNNGTSPETRNEIEEDKEPGGPTLQKFFEYLGPVKTIPQLVDETVDRFQTIYRSPKVQLKSLEQPANPSVATSENEIQRRKRSADAIFGKRLTPNRKITKRAGDDTSCVSNSDLQEHKLNENEEINAIKEEMQKLKDLIVILRDQQHVVDILNGIRNQKNDLNSNPHTDQNNNNDENVKMLKFMEALFAHLNSQSNQTQKSTTTEILKPLQRSDNFEQITTTTTEEPPTKNSEEEMKELVGNLRNIEQRLSRLIQLKQRMAETKEAEEREAEGRSLNVPSIDNNTETTTTLSPPTNNSTEINNSTSTVEDHKNNKDAAILSRIDEIRNILDKLTDSQLKLQQQHQQHPQSDVVMGDDIKLLLARKPQEENTTSVSYLKTEQLAKTLQLLRYLQDISNLQTELEKDRDKEQQIQSDQAMEGLTNFEIQLNNLSKVINETVNSDDNRTRNASDETERMRDVDDEDEDFETEVISQALENLDEGEEDEDDEVAEEMKPPPVRSYRPVSSSEHIYSDYGGNYNGRPPIPVKPTPYYTKSIDPDYLKHVCKSMQPYHPPSPPSHYVNQNHYRPYRPPYTEKPPFYYKENRPMHHYQDRYPEPYKNIEVIPPPPRPMPRPQYPHQEDYESPRDTPYGPPFLDSPPGRRPVPYGRSSSPDEQRPMEGNPQEQQRHPFQNPSIQSTPPRNVEDLKLKLRSLEARVAELGHVEDSNEEQQRHVQNLQRLISNLKGEIQEANAVQQSLNFIPRNKREIRDEDVNVERQAGELVDRLYNMLETSRLAYDDPDNDALLQQLPRASMERTIETEQKQLQSQIEQLKKQIDATPADVSKTTQQPSGDDSVTSPPDPTQERTSTSDEQSDKARTLSHHTGPSRYYHGGGHSDNYGSGYGVEKHYGHKKADILGTIIEKIFDKLQHAIPAIIKGLVGDFIDGAFHDQGYAGYGSGYGYAADKYDYGHDISYKFKSFGLLGTLPLALLNILSTVSYFFKLLQKNKFIRNFLVPVGVIIAVTGLVAFLVFWFNYDAFAGSMYGSYEKIGYDNYQKGGYDGYHKVGYEDHQKGGSYYSYQKPGYKGVSYSPPSYSYKKPYYRESNVESFTPPFTHNLDKPAVNHQPSSFPGIVTQINDNPKPKM